MLTVKALTERSKKEFVDYDIDLLFDDATEFNEKMKTYPEFYNTKGVHRAFKNKKAPLEVLAESEYHLSKLPPPLLG